LGGKREKKTFKKHAQKGEWGGNGTPKLLPKKDAPQGTPAKHPINLHKKGVRSGGTVGTPGQVKSRKPGPRVGPCAQNQKKGKVRGEKRGKNDKRPMTNGVKAHVRSEG